MQGEGSTGVVHAPYVELARKIPGNQDAYLHVASFMLGETLVREAIDFAIDIASLEATPVV